jgi:hypothetical protein
MSVSAISARSPLIPESTEKWDVSAFHLPKDVTGDMNSAAELSK